MTWRTSRRSSRRTPASRRVSPPGLRKTRLPRSAPSPSGAEVLAALLIAALVALSGVTTLWLRERQRSDRLERELEEERAKPIPRNVAPPPLKAVLQTAARVREEGLGEVLRSSFEELAG